MLGFQKNQFSSESLLFNNMGLMTHFSTPVTAEYDTSLDIYGKGENHESKKVRHKASTAVNS